MEAPEAKRAVSFFDGQNLYRHAKDAFRYHHPNFDPVKLMDHVCRTHGWSNHGIRFYTGVPAAEKSPLWHGYWSRRLLATSRAGILVTKWTVRYHRETAILTDGSRQVVETAQEKGIDVRIALDIVRLTLARQFDVAVIFSQDSDLAEVAMEVRSIAAAQRRWIKVASAYPSGPDATSKRGIDGTDWIPLDRATYDTCLDPRDYRPRPAGG